MSERREDPHTRDEWQDAVDAAAGALALESARQYSLVIGGPTVLTDRCVEILRAGKVKGIVPHTNAIERFLKSVSLQEEIDRS